MNLLVILDGASEPIRSGPTALERAHTPALDALARGGALSRKLTVAPWLAPGSETAIPALLGWTPPGPVDRGLVEAAAREIALAEGEHAWRIDVVDGVHGRADAQTVAIAAERLKGVLPGYRVNGIGAHRLLVVGPRPLPTIAEASDLRIWPQGVVPPAILADETIMIAAYGAAAGIARLLGATVEVPAGATGRPGSDLAAKAAAAQTAIAAAAGIRQVVVHVGGPDEASHQRDADAKVAAIEAADRDIIGPLAAAVAAASGTFVVCPDHGCDPATGRHDADAVPCLTWPSSSGPHGRLTERAVAALPVIPLTTATTT